MSDGQRGSQSSGRQDTLSPRGEFFNQTKEGRKLRKQSTGFSTLFNGRLDLDPSIRALSEERLGVLRTGFTRFSERSGKLRSRFEGNRGALIEARTRPTTEFVNRSLQGFERRGLGGSSFKQQAAETGATAIGDARALGEFETLEAISGIDRAQIQAAFQFASQLGEVGAARLEQELAGLGLTHQQIAMFLNSYEASQQRVLERRKAISSSITGTIGKGGKKDGGGKKKKEKGGDG